MVAVAASASYDDVVAADEVVASVQVETATAAAPVPGCTQRTELAGAPNQRDPCRTSTSDRKLQGRASPRQRDEVAAPAERASWIVTIAT
jgi:hypothetical protein